ncbi:actin nucleation-promoting factor WASL-like [Palaemon carinicauda]|uniref:actin nucleation-promoting factor WASL-like n=1 Tax=Palaemon carinicauda TaxID=392227 RepID=UPI0035B60858
MSSETQPRKPPPPHAISLLLSKEENECVFAALNPRCQSQATAVVEVYGTAPANHSIWNKLGVGIATFIKDNSRRSYFIQVYDSQICTQQTSGLPPLLIEQEIYREFSYHVSRGFFHQFEGDERTIGLNFAEEEEARLFSSAVQSLLIGRQKKRDERKREAIQKQQKLWVQQQQDQALQERVTQIRSQQQHEVREQHQSKSSKYRTIRGMKKLMDKYGNSYKEKPRKLEIGPPTDFKHISHAGLDSAFNVNPDVEELLKNIGFGSRDISEPKTQQYVMNFIENVGGIDEVRKMNRKLSTNRGFSPGLYSPRKAYRQAHGFPEIEERSPTSSFTTPPPESPAPSLPAEYLSYCPPLPPRDSSSGTYLVNAPVPPTPMNVTYQSGHGKRPSLYSTKVSSNEDNQRFPTTPSGRLLPVIQNTSSTGNPRPSMASSRTGPLHTPQSSSSEAFTNNSVVPPSPPMSRSLAPPIIPAYSSRGPPPPPQRTTGSHGSLPATKPPLLAGSHGLATTPTSMPSGWRSAPTPPGLSGGRGITPSPPQMSSGGGSAPTPPPMRRSSGSPPTPPPMPGTTGSAPTPPSMLKNHGQASLPPQMTPSTGLIPPPPPLPSSMVPVRPPPPKHKGKGLAPQPPTMPSNNQSSPGNQHSALLEQIRGTRTLKSVSPEAPKKEAPTDARSELLERIRTGVTLTHVETSETRGDDSDAPAKLEGWALDLHNALMKREQFIQSSDDSEEDDVDDDDDWDESD